MHSVTGKRLSKTLLRKSLTNSF